MTDGTDCEAGIDTEEVPIVEPTVETLSLRVEDIERETAKRAADTGAQRQVNTEALLNKLQAQAAAKEAIDQANARKLVKKWMLAVLGVVGVPAGGYGALVLANDDPPPVKAVDVQQTVEDRSHELEQAIEQNAEGVAESAKNIRTLGEEVVRIQDEQAEATQYISDKLDAISPKAAKVEAPPSVRRAKKRADDAKLQERVDELFGAGELEE